MTDDPLSPFERDLQAVLDVPGPRADFSARLRSQLNAPHPNPRTRRPVRIGLGWRVGFGLALALIAAILVIGPGRVAASVRGWLGSFLPGVGFLQNTSDLRVLDTPINLSVDGAAFSVEKGYANAEETVMQVRYGSDPRTCSGSSSLDSWSGNQARLQQAAYLLLKDGSKLYAQGRFATWGKFPALPAGSGDFTLVVPPLLEYTCQGERGGAVCLCLDADKQWSIPIHLTQAQPGAVLPVIESRQLTAEVTLPTDLPDEATAAVHPQPSATPETQALPQPNLEGRLVVQDDGYLLVVGLVKPENGSDTYYTFGNGEHKARLTDASGAELPLVEIERSEVNLAQFEPSPWRDVLVFKTQGTSLHGPLMVTFSDLVLGRSSFGPEAAFDLTLPAEPKAGQGYAQNVSLEPLPGHPMLLKDVQVTSVSNTSLGVILNYSGSGIESIDTQQDPMADPPSMGSSGACPQDQNGCVYNETSLQRQADGQFHLKIANLETHVQGSWSVQFDLSS